ncbi:MAG: ATP-binding cassette domain-containing protein, partial [Acidobacteriota bacterium]
MVAAANGSSPADTEGLIADAAGDTHDDVAIGDVKLSVRDLTISYGGNAVLRDVNLDIHEHEIFGIIGPANSGKTSFLRAINRMDMFTPSMQIDGAIEFDGRDVRDWRNVYALRSRIGVVFPLPVGLPM